MRSSNAFSRQESVRQFVNLIANGGVPALKNFQGALDEAAKTNLAHQRAQARLDQSLIVRMHQASTNLGIALVQGANPVLENLIARPTIWASTEAIKHPNVVQGVEAGAFTLGAANALRRMGAFGKLTGRFGGKFGKFLGGATALEQGAITSAISKEELPSLISGGKTDGTRGNPFWVVISPVSWSMGGPTGSGGGNNSPGGGGGLFGLFKKAPLMFGRTAAEAAAGFIAAKGTWDYINNPSKAPRGHHGWTWAVEHPVGSFESTLGDIFGRGGPDKFSRMVALKKHPALLNALQASGQMNAYLQGGITKIEFAGNPKADLTIKLVDAQGRTITVQEHKGVAILPKAKTFPTSQGKPGSRKGT